MKTWLVVFHALLVFSLLFWLPLYLMSGMAFAASGSTIAVYTTLMMYSILWHPLGVIIGGIIFWISSKKDDWTGMIISSCVSAAAPIFFTFSFIMMATACDGKFSCY